MPTPAYPIPRLPVLSPASFKGNAEADTPCMLSLPGMVLTTSGRASILLGLESLGIGAGDRVLLPTYHCPTMVAPVVHLQAEPVFYPVDRWGTPSLAWIESQDLRDVRAFLVAHLFGLPQPMAALRHWCDARGIALLEDCAHALFGRSGERPIGAWGDVAIGSLTKFMPLTTGGCLVMAPSQKAMARPPPTLVRAPLQAGARVVLDAVELSALHGRLPGLSGLVTATLSALRGGRASTKPSGATEPAASQCGAELATMSAIDAQLAYTRLPASARWLALHIPRDGIVAKRRARYEQLSRRLSGHTGLFPLLPDLPPDCAPYVFPLWVAQPDPGYATLRSLRMPVFRWDRLWPTVPRIEGDQGVLWSHHVLQLACHQDLSDADLDSFVHCLLRLYATRPQLPRSIASAPQQPRTTLEAARP